MSEPNNLLLRWARLKQAAKAAEAIDGALPDPDAMAPAEPPFDPTSLPSIESITGGTDIIAFLQAGVPAELTQAALRRAWTTDPAIRGFIGIAENQWDFNDPSAIPGFGPLLPAESGVDILAQISSRPELQPSAFGDLTVAEPAPSNADTYEFDRQLADGDPLLASSGAVPDELQATPAVENVPAAIETRKSRRHGSALPH
jgi:hypothetical protein